MRFLLVLVDITEDAPFLHRCRRYNHRSPGGERHGKRKRSAIFLERTREGHRQSDEHGDCFKGNAGERSETGKERIIMGFSERIDTILN